MLDQRPGNDGARDPVLDVLEDWGVSELVLLEDRQAFQTWKGLGSVWGGRLDDGRSVVIEVQDTVAEPWLEYVGGFQILDLREHAARLADEVRSLEGQAHSALTPWLRVEHDHARALLLWMRESKEGEGVAIPSADASPPALLQWLEPVWGAVDWARQHSTFGLCVSPENLVWHGARSRAVGWGREAFDRFVTCRNGETRVGVMEPEISKALKEGHIPLRRLMDISPNADVSVPSLISTWLRLRLGKKQVWYAYQLNPLPERERGVLMSWLDSDPLRGRASQLFRELGDALRSETSGFVKRIRARRAGKGPPTARPRKRADVVPRTRSWRSAETLQVGGGDGYAPQVAAASNGDAVAIWLQSDAGTRNVYASRFTSGRWAAPVRLDDDDANHSAEPQVAIGPRGDAVIVWREVHGGVFSVYARRLVAGVWKGPERVGWGEEGQARYPQVAMGADGRAVVVWEQAVTEIFVDRSGGRHRDGRTQPQPGHRESTVYACRLLGGTWGSPERVTAANTRDARSPKIAVGPNGDAVAVWCQRDGEQHRSYASRLTPAGWETPHVLDRGHEGNAGVPRVKVGANGEGVAVWLRHDGRESTIFASRLLQGKWGDAQPLEDDARYHDCIGLAVDAQGSALVVWVQGEWSALRVYASRWAANEWEAPKQISPNLGRAFGPRVATDPRGSALVVWGQLGPDTSHVYARSFEDGTWRTTELLQLVDGKRILAGGVAAANEQRAVAVWEHFDGTRNVIRAGRYE